MLDDLPQNSICYSLGIGTDVSWDLQMAGYGAQVFQFDHTVAGPPEPHENFHFAPVMIGAQDDAKNNIRSLAGAIEQNRHIGNIPMIMKMDIEDSEWEVLAATPTEILARFEQIVLEFHGLNRLYNGHWYTKLETTLRHMRRSHMPVHVHGNNFGGISVIEGVPVPDVLEVTYASRHRYMFSRTDEIFPTPLDRPCNSTLPDLFLGAFQY